MCMFLKRFSYQYIYFDMIPCFARPVPQICMITNMVMSHIYDNFLHLLSDKNLFLVLQMQFTEKVPQCKIAGVLLMALCALFIDHRKLKE